MAIHMNGWKKYMKGCKYPASITKLFLLSKSVLDVGKILATKFNGMIFVSIQLSSFYFKRLKHSYKTQGKLSSFSNVKK